jgi:hypothetical protein
MDHTPSLSAFSRLLDLYPAAFSGNRLNLLLLEDAEAIRDGKGYLQRLDSLSLMDESREYLVDEPCPWPFPRARLEERPDPWLVSNALFSRLDEARTILPTQGDIAEIIDRRVRQRKPRAVALIIADGLSYYDLPPDADAEPVLVAGITSTAFGYREAIGQPSISRRLFALGYANQLGFTYFDQRANDLSRDVYASFALSQITRVKAFSEVLDVVNRPSDAATYIQITMAGLDQLSHAHWDQPPREQYVQRVLDNYAALAESLRRRSGSALAVLTADHGILWREHVEDRLQIADDLFVEDIGSPRYVKGSVLRAYGRVCRCRGQNYTLLRVPYMTRRFRNNEWGVHGGISAWESVVPLIMREE